MARDSPSRAPTTPISGIYAKTAHVCNGLPVYQKGGSDGLVLYQQDDYKYWHVGSSARVDCGYEDPIYLTSEGFCAASPAGAGCANQWHEWPGGDGIPHGNCPGEHCPINSAVKVVELPGMGVSTRVRDAAAVGMPPPPPCARPLCIGIVSVITDGICVEITYPGGRWSPFWRSVTAGIEKLSPPFQEWSHGKDVGGHGEESKCDTSKYSLIYTIDPYDGWDSMQNGGKGDVVMRKYAPNKPAADPDLSMVAGHKVSEVPKTNGRFCATVKLADANPYFKPVTFKLCVDSTNLASGKVWQHLSNGQTSIWDGKKYTTELQGDQCSAYPADSNHFWGTFNRVLAVPSDATQLDKQTWARTSYQNWEGSNHTCTGNNAGTRTRESWTLSETMTNGTYDVLKHVTTFEDCEGGKWHLQQEDGYEFISHTRDVNTSIFERPASYCYDPQHWVQSHQCKSIIPKTPFSPARTVDGCAPLRPGEYTGCCAPKQGAKPSCNEPVDCSSRIYGKAHP